MGRYHPLFAPDPAETGATSQARQASSASNAFSSLNSRQASGSISVIVEDDGLTSYDEDEDDDAAASAPAPAVPTPTAGRSLASLIFSDDSSPPSSPVQKPTPFPEGQAHHGDIGFSNGHGEYDPTRPHFNNPASAWSAPWGGSPAPAPLPHPQGTQGCPQSSRPYYAPPTNSSPLGGPVQAALPANSPHSAFAPPVDNHSQSAFPPPLQGSAVSAFAPIQAQPQTVHPIPAMDSPEFASNVNSNFIPLGRKSRWNVGPPQPSQAVSQPSRREQQAQPQQPSHSMGPGGGLTPLENQHTRARPTPDAHQGGHHNQMQSPPAIGARNYSQRSNETQDPRLKFRHPANQQQQPQHNGNGSGQMLGNVSAEAAAAFLNNMLHDLQASGVVAGHTPPQGTVVDVDMGAPPPLGPPVHMPYPVDQDAAMDTSPCFQGPSHIVVENANYEQDADMDVDIHPVVPTRTTYLQNFVLLDTSGPMPAYGYVSTPIHPAASNAIPYVGAAAAVPIPSEAVTANAVVHHQWTQPQRSQALCDDMEVDDDSSQPNNNCALAPGLGGFQSSNATAPVPVPPNAPNAPQLPASSPTSVPDGSTFKPNSNDKGKAPLKALPAPANSQTSPLAFKAKLRPASGVLKSSSETNKSKLVLLKEKSQVAKGKENADVVSPSQPSLFGTIAKARDPVSAGKEKAKAVVQPTVVSPRPASPGSSGLGNDEKAQMTALPSHSVVEEKALVLYDAKGKGKAKAPLTTEEQRLKKKPSSEKIEASSVTDKGNARSRLTVEGHKSSVSKANGKVKTGLVCKSKTSSQLASGSSSSLQEESPIRKADKEPRDEVTRPNARSAADKGTAKAALIIDKPRSQPLTDNSESDIVVVQQSISRIRSQLESAENLLVELQAKSGETPPPRQLPQTPQRKLDSVGNAVVPQPRSSYTPQCTPPQVIQNPNVGDQKDEAQTYTPKDTPPDHLVRGEHVANTSPSHTPEDTPPYRLLQNFKPDPAQHGQAAISAITQSAPAKLANQREEPRPAVIGTPVYMIPGLSPSTGGSTSNVIDTFKNVKAFRASAPCTPPTPTPLSSSSSPAALSRGNLLNEDLIDFGEDESDGLGSSQFSSFSSCASTALLNLEDDKLLTSPAASDKTTSTIWDDLASLNSPFAFIGLDIDNSFAARPEEPSIDDMLSEIFARCFSLVDPPLVDLTSGEVDPSREAIPQVLKVDRAVQASEPIERQIEITRYMESAAQDIEAINHRLSINIESSRPLTASVRVNKRKVSSKLRPCKEMRTPRYVECSAEGPNKRVRLSSSDDLTVIVLADPIRPVPPVSISPSHKKTTPPRPSRTKESEKSAEAFKDVPVLASTIEEKVMPGAFPIDENQIQYGPGVSFSDLFRKLLWLCFGW